ncbi:hypothetical protein IFR05_004187 [Cadophora sp. M221]|nr:hypothetical protein IFR05_004187 [Cadophora sp. M221]
MTFIDFALVGTGKLSESPRNLAEELAFVNFIIARVVALPTKSEPPDALRNSTVSKTVLHDAPLKKKMQANFIVM